jgi:hypothetical protein
MWANRAKQGCRPEVLLNSTAVRKANRPEPLQTISFAATAPLVMANSLWHKSAVYPSAPNRSNPACKIWRLLHF